MPEPENDNPKLPPAKQEKEPTVPSGTVLAGADKLFDSDPHVGVAIEVAASGKISHLIIADALSVSEGAPIFITAPVRIEGQYLKNYLKSKEFALPESIENLLKNLKISCEAFYFSTQKKALSEAEAKKYVLDRHLSASTTPTDTEVVAGYEVEDGPLLMVFEVKVDGGLIGTLTKDKDLGALFDVNSIMVRVLRCPSSKRQVLEDYVRSLPQS
jgi:hypothetical protein